MAETQQTELPEELNNRVVILNGFNDAEIRGIIGAVRSIFKEATSRGIYEEAPDIIFARTTQKSIKMRLQDLIVDMSEDHAYLKQNPPEEVQRKRREMAEQTQEQGAEAAEDGAESTEARQATETGEHGPGESGAD